MTEEKPWRFGAFHIAKSLGIRIQPFRLAYNQMRRVAYIDDDHFALHLWQLLASENLSVTIELADPFEVGDPEQDARYWWQWSRHPLVAANSSDKDAGL
jgi:1-acyl-sn-glycerol-3-phosphate acyltransferase